MHSDHRNLHFFQQNRILTPRHARWQLLLSDFDFKIVYTPASTIREADALSRQSEPTVDRAKITLLPKSTWLQLRSASIYLPTLDLNIDPDDDWPLIICHFLVNDSWPENISEDLLNKCKREAIHFRILNNDHRDFVRNLDTNGTSANYLPASQRQSTILKFHGTLGHMGVDSLLPLIQRRFWFPKMRQKIQEIISQCTTCQQNRPDSTRSAPLRPIPPAALPFERWGFDFVGPLPTSKSGNRYILTAIDYATRWVVAKPYPNKSSNSVIHFLYHHILMEYGSPYEIFTDRDKAFLEDALPHYEQLLRIKHFSTTSYHPQTNGMVERMHRMLNHSMKCLAQDHMDRWDEFLPQVIFGIRARTHSVTKFSPFYLAFGIEPRLPIDTLPPRSVMMPLDQIEQMEERSEFIAREFDALGLSRRAATERSIAQADAMRARSGLPESELKHRFEIGDWVKLKIPRNLKWDRQWSGPFFITKLAHYPTYYLMTSRGDWINTPINEARLAPWKGNNENTINPIDDISILDHFNSTLDNEDVVSEGENNVLEID